MALVMFFGTLSVASAADRFYAKPINFEPGETRTVSFCLENSQDYFGFQADINLPEGLEIVTTKGNPDCALSSRANSSYAFVSNLLSTQAIRVGAFSTNHTPISDNSGVLLSIKVKAADSFAGGTLTVSDILFTDESNNDVALPEFNLEITNTHIDLFYIPDFSINVGETKDISIILDNETSFTAFQTDIYLPDGLTIVENSPVMTDRGLNHTISAKAFSDGRVRLACMSLSNTSFTGDSGALVTLQVTASKGVSPTCQIELKNQRFSTTDAQEHMIPNSTTEVTIDGELMQLVESIQLSQTQLKLEVGEEYTLEAVVLPENATDKSVVWSTSDNTIVSVKDGVITALASGTATITVSATDGSDVQATCEVEVMAQSGVTSVFAYKHDANGIYTLEGRLVKATATADDIANLGSGYYIINGKKVLIK
jgi:hypothetical protein